MRPELYKRTEGRPIWALQWDGTDECLEELTKLGAVVRFPQVLPDGSVWVHIDGGDVQVPLHYWVCKVEGAFNFFSPKAFTEYERAYA